MTGLLYIVATPIGNLEDLSKRALKTLEDADLILAEDTRVTSKLLSHFEIDKPILSYHQHSDDNTRLKILGYLISGKKLALTTDAGTPGISDPGNELINYILEREPDIKVVPIPGPSALITALSVCGFRADKFVFIGFLPKKKRTKLFKWLKEGKITFAFFESPKRILKTLEVLKEEFPKKRVFVARELTKMYETLYRGSFEKVLEKIKKDKLKGEIVVVVEN
jgi:16S rRNA (cytidine1402-2'-O)-methyltransferase